MILLYVLTIHPHFRLAPSVLNVWCCLLYCTKCVLIFESVGELINEIIQTEATFCTEQYTCPFFSAVYRVIQEVPNFESVK